MVQSAYKLVEPEPFRGNTFLLHHESYDKASTTTLNINIVTMNILTLLALPMALAMPTVQTTNANPNITHVPFSTSPSRPGNFCNGMTYTPRANGHSATFLDCLSIMKYAQTNIGEWELKAATDPNDQDNWQMLSSMGNCALLVKNTEPTVISDQDVFDMLNKVWHVDGIHDGPLEVTGTWEKCQVYRAPYQQNVTGVQFWVRDSNLAGNW
ncbi:hypothetical protein F5Y18DRAFT_429334 [Xylariaceae sp. FL1019]|nr:hypothetical protein F5Y18DRAFT_429334 [Xylariaceae sp. FL1019]